MLDEANAKAKLVIGIIKKLAAADVTGKNFRKGRRTKFASPYSVGQEGMFDFSVFDNVDFNY